MYIKQMIDRMIKTEKNAINKMYLNEIVIKLKKLEQATEAFADDDKKLAEYVDTLSMFAQTLAKPKYKYNKSSNGGFKPGMEIFEPIYIEDLISEMIKKIANLDQPGISWGYQRFASNVKFYQKTLFIQNRNPGIEFKKSAKFLMLAQNIDTQFRMTGKRTSRFSSSFFVSLFFFFSTKKASILDSDISGTHPFSICSTTMIDFPFSKVSFASPE